MLNDIVNGVLGLAVGIFKFAFYGLLPLFGLFVLYLLSFMV